MNKARVLLAATLAMMAGCQTTKPIEVTLPAALEGAFDTCGRSDGEVSFLIGDTENASFNGTAEWVSTTSQNWEVIVYNVMGQNLLKTKLDKQQLETSGPLAERIPKLKVDKNEFLQVDGHFAGFRATEIPCLLKWKLPHAWRSNIWRTEEKDGSLHLFGGDNDREWEIIAPKSGDLRSRDVCANLTWSHFMGLMHSRVNMCLHFLSPQRGVLTGMKSYRFEWKNAEEN